MLPVPQQLPHGDLKMLDLPGIYKVCRLLCLSEPGEQRITRQNGTNTYSNGCYILVAHRQHTCASPGGPGLCQQQR